MILLMQGLRCAACVNKSEKTVEALPGVLEFRINYSNHRAVLRWQATQLSLKQVLTEIRQLGYDAIPHRSTQQESRFEEHRRKEFTRLVVAVFCSMNLMWIAIAQYAGYFSGISQRATDLFNLASFLLATPVLFFSGKPFFVGAWAALRQRSLSMDFQISASTSLIYAYSLYAAVTRTGETYFEAVAMFILFISIGKHLELLATQKITEVSRHLKTLLPFAATRWHEGRREQVELDQIEPGWLLEAQPGERIVADGRVVEGHSSVDESHLTGESFPVSKQSGALLSSGSINLEGFLRYEVLRPVSDSTISRIVNLVEDALTRKPRTRQLADSLSGYFVSFVTLTAALVFGWELWSGSPLEQGLVHAVSVLIIACPCALSLATPISVLTGLSAAAERKILFRSGAQFETLYEVTDVILDKTGTLTQGNPEVVLRLLWDEDAPALAQALTQLSRHPISRAVQQSQTEITSETLPELVRFEEIPGQGIRAQWGNHRLLGGNPDFLRANQVHFSPEQEQELEQILAQRQTCFLLAKDEQLISLHAISDPLRPESAEAVAQLRDLGLNIHLLTGDHSSVAHNIAQQVGIAQHQVLASQRPEDKQAFVEQLHSTGRKVIMVGDGINDAPSLARADIGIAMGSAADKALEISDIVLLDNDLRSIVRAMELSRNTFGLIRQNLRISSLYNVVAIPLAVFGWVIPLIAALSMSASSLLVVLNSLRVRAGLRRRLASPALQRTSTSANSLQIRSA